MKPIVWILILLLLVLHHDFWFWEDARLVWGCIPVGLFYHMALSLLATLVWLYCVTLAWPGEDDGELEHGGSSNGRPQRRTEKQKQPVAENHQ